MILVDNAYIDYRGSQYCHMASDVLDERGIVELHLFAKSIGMKFGWYQNNADHPHYDVSKTMRAKAVQAGATEVDTQEFFFRCSKRGRAWKLKQETV